MIDQGREIGGSNDIVSVSVFASDICGEDPDLHFDG